MTNFEAIKQMNLEELALFLCTNNNIDFNDPNIEEDIQCYKDYLSEENGNRVLEVTRKLISLFR